MRWFNYVKYLCVPKMSFHDFVPPPSVRGMTVLDREAFSCVVSIPHLLVDCHYVSRATPVVKPLFLKLENFRPVVDADSDAERADVKRRKIYVDPRLLTDRESVTKKLSDVGVPGTWGESEVTLTYANWKYKEIFDAVLPSDVDSVSGFSRVGHVIHLNLREALTEYKSLIGQVLLDKIANVRTVINKASCINNTFRNLPLEVLAGDGDLEVTVIENGCRFAFDFAKVYWNPRLGTEHERVLWLFRENDVVVDVFAGVGPFAIPAAKRKCAVHANDLNPEAYKYLKSNAALNRVNIECFNLDGGEFILTEGLRVLKNHWKEHQEAVDLKTVPKVHFLMNLPALALDFLEKFIGLTLESGWNAKQIKDELLPLVHVYCFTKGPVDSNEVVNMAVQQVEEHLCFPLKGSSTLTTTLVRSVAPQKEMVRVSFRIPKEVLFRRDSELQREDDEIKRRNVEA